MTASTRLQRVCAAPPNALTDWTHGLDNSWTKRNCTRYNDDYGEWTLLNAYRSVGIKGYHWKYVTDGNTDSCLKDWTYYSKNGIDIVAEINGSTTTKGDKNGKPWCALPHYDAGGLAGRQWAYCWCWNESPCARSNTDCDADADSTSATKNTRTHPSLKASNDVVGCHLCCDTVVKHARVATS